MPLDLTAVDLLTETVTTPRLLLRPWRLDDADEVALACQDAEIANWLPLLPSPYTRDDAVEYLTAVAGNAQGTGLIRAIEEAAGGRLVGSIGITGLTEIRGAEIGYWVAPWARGHRYAAEATDELARWAFSHGVHRVSLLAATGNVPSQRAAERAGFVREGVLRGAHRDRTGTPRDMGIYGRLSTDPAPAGPATA